MSKNTFEEAEDFLMHWGILGMKWGVRRYQNPDGTLTAAGRKRYGVGDPMNDPQQNQQMSSSPSSQSMPYSGNQPYPYPNQSYQNQPVYNRPKTVSEMSDDEIRAILNRADLERRYRELMNPPKKKSAVAEFVKDVLSSSAKNVAKKWTTQTLENIVFKNKDNGKDDDSTANAASDIFVNKFEKRFKKMENALDFEKRLEKMEKTLIDARKSKEETPLLTDGKNKKKDKTSEDRESGGKKSEKKKRREDVDSDRSIDEAYDFVSRFLRDKYSS